MLPSFPEMRPLALEDCELFTRFFAARPPQQSEFTFTNLFMWRDAYSLRVTQLGEAVLLFSWRPDPEDSFLFPPLGDAKEGAVRAGTRAAWPRRGITRGWRGRRERIWRGWGCARTGIA